MLTGVTGIRSPGGPARGARSLDAARGPGHCRATALHSADTAAVDRAPRPAPALTVPTPVDAADGLAGLPAYDPKALGADAVSPLARRSKEAGRSSAKSG